MKQKGYPRCIFETNAKILVDAFKEVKGKAYIHTIISDCIYFKHFENVLFEYVRRSENEVAQKLAQVTHSIRSIRESYYITPNLSYKILVIDYV